MRVLVTGGAGYVGQHIAVALSGGGADVLILDKEKTYVPTTSAQGDAMDPISYFTRGYGFEPDAIVHAASLTRVAESVEKASMYMHSNFLMAQSVAEYAKETGIPVVNLSSAAVYGECTSWVDEAAPLRPINPYGASKVAAEAVIHALVPKAVSLRLFNVVGVEIGLSDPRRPMTHICPILCRSIFRGDKLSIYGNAVRDYVHVRDVCSCVSTALHALADGKKLERVYNVGTGTKTPTFDLVAAFAVKHCHHINFDLTGVREGDPSVLVADNTLMQRDLVAKLMPLSYSIGSEYRYWKQYWEKQHEQA